MTERYSIRKCKHTGRYDVFLGGFTPMYCASYEAKKEAQNHIKSQKKYYEKNYKQ